MVFSAVGLARQLQPAPGARVVATQTMPTLILQVIFRKGVTCACHVHDRLTTANVVNVVNKFNIAAT
jgi:hypothetical protein